MDYPCDSSSSTVGSDGYVSLSSSSSIDGDRYSNPSTELRLGVGTSTTKPPSIKSDQVQHSGWPPIRAHHRSQLAVQRRNPATFFIKVYMEGAPIGRKIDLFAVRDYGELVTELEDMFKAKISVGLCDDDASQEGFHLLAYEDKEGDWMMVGDVPWEIFLLQVKRLKIRRAAT